MKLLHRPHTPFAWQTLVASDSLHPANARVPTSCQPLGAMALLVPLLLLSACSTQPTRSVGHLDGATQAASMAVPTSNAVRAPATERTYLMQVGDSFDVKFFHTPELNESVVIRPDGKISLQLVGDVQAAGMGVAELEQALRQRYAKELRNPSISVIVKNFTPPRVFVAGEVRTPGELVMQGDMTALQAIARAGFFTPDAKTGQVVILRYKGPRGPEFITMDAGHMLERPSGEAPGPLAHISNDVVLEPMDVVYVAQTPIASVADFFNRYVNNIIPLWRNLGFSMIYYTNTAKTVSSGGAPTITNTGGGIVNTGNGSAGISNGVAGGGTSTSTR